WPPTPRSRFRRPGRSTGSRSWTWHGPGGIPGPPPRRGKSSASSASGSGTAGARRVRGCAVRPDVALPSDLAAPLPARGLTTADVAARSRVSQDKVRHWVSCGELAAVNTAGNLAGRPRWVFLPCALLAFERRRAGGHRRSDLGGERG